ncbi:MAG: DUF1622 domain-containing protein [Nitriliruptoraceae bacterium]
MEALELVHQVVLAVEVVAVAILAVGVAIVLVRGGIHLARGRPWTQVYEDLRVGIGRALLLGLEVLIAADIIATVVLELTIANVAALGLIVLIRTFLSWSIQLETTGYWPWQQSENDRRTS